MSKPVVGLMGRCGVGKNTTAEVLVRHGFREISFAGRLKDVTAALFGWDRTMLEGNTCEARNQRECVDLYWSECLDLPDFSPRRALQLVGTDVLRRHFRDDLWILATGRDIYQALDDPSVAGVVVTDVRFPNEARFLRDKFSAILGRVYRDENECSWLDDGMAASRGESAAAARLSALGVHESEWKWMALNSDVAFFNSDALPRAVFQKQVEDTCVAFGLVPSCRVG